MSAPPYLIAVETYGSQRVRAPASGAMVSAYKLGYSTVGKAVLLKLYGSQTLDVTSRHTSYHYVHISGATCVHHGYLLLALTEAEFTQVKQITRQHPAQRTGIWWWHDQQWRHFPYANAPHGEAEFALPVGRTGPNFDPTRLHPISPSSGEQVATVQGIQAEYSQHSPDEPGWWWLPGDTYPQRDLLKRHGCRWSKKRSAWYFTGKTLPPAVQTLIAKPSQDAVKAPINADAPCSDAEAERILGVKLAQKPEPAKPIQREHRFKLGQTVYLATSLRVEQDKKLPMDTRGTVIRRYAYRKMPDFRHELAYAVDFGEHGIHTLFQDSLDSQPQNLKGIERHEIIPVMFGVSPEQGILAEIERRQRIPRAYAVLDELPAPAPASTEPLPPSDAEMPAEPPHIRIIAPEPLSTSDDAALSPVQSAIRQAQQTPFAPMVTHATASQRRTPIQQQFCGELTGSITGNVYCYGFAVYQGVLLYLNLGGPKMAVEAIRARLSKGEVVNLVPPDAPALELSAGETDGKANTGMYSAYLQNLPEAKFTSAILVHECLTAPTYLGKSVTGIFRASEAQAAAKLLHHVRQLVNIPVFDLWASFLYHAGQTAGLVRNPHPHGGIDLLVVDLDGDAWTRLVTGGLANRVIALA
jgi:hypothetical protein